MAADIFFEAHLPDALRRAQEYAGEDGFVASLPQLLHARATADYDNIIWNTCFTPLRTRTTSTAIRLNMPAKSRHRKRATYSRVNFLTAAKFLSIHSRNSNRASAICRFAMVSFSISNSPGNPCVVTTSLKS